MNILAVDPDPANLMALTLLLQKLGAGGGARLRPPDGPQHP